MQVVPWRSFGKNGDEDGPLIARLWRSLGTGMVWRSEVETGLDKEDGYGSDQDEDKEKSERQGRAADGARMGRVDFGFAGWSSRQSLTTLPLQQPEAGRGR